jgi:hypothetical protein
MKSGAMLAFAIAATAAAALAWNSNDDPPSASPATAAPPPAAGHADPSDPHAGVPGAPALSPGGALPPGHPPIDGANPHADPHGAMPPGHPPIDGRHDGGPIAVQPLPDGVTVAQIVRDAEALAGKRVKLAAKVVKSTPNVLGRTWLHVQDGSGDAGRGDHDLVVTTQDPVQIGDVVELEGMVVRDRDLGSGYRYEVLLDDATVRPRSAQSGEAPR